MKASFEEFVKVWQESNSQAEVMEKLSISKSACEHAAKRLRKAGVPLKAYSNHTSNQLTAEKVAALKALCGPSTTVTDAVAQYEAAVRKPNS